MIRQLSLALIIVLAALAIPVGPVQAESGSTSCLEVRSGVESDVADIRANVTQSPNASDTIRITYDTRTLSKGFSVVPPRDTEVVATRGFSFDESEDRYRYNGGDSPLIEYSIGVEGEQRQYASSENWIFAPVPTHVDVGVNLHPRPAGVIGDEFLFIGNYTKYAVSQGCHKISVIISESSELGTSPDEILRALRYTAAEHDIGHQYENVRIFATPGNVKPGADGFADENEAWVSTALPPSFQDSHIRVFVHEYIHTRQAFGGTEFRSMSWFNEGLADYYSYKFLLDLGYISPVRYNQWLQNGSEMHGVLVDPDTWESSQVGYTRSGAFLAVLDAKIQNETNSSLEEVVRRINVIAGPNSRLLFGEHLFLELVQNVSTNKTMEWANATMTSGGEFEIAEAVVEEPETQFGVLSKVEQSIREKPFAAILTAFLFGMLVIMLLNERNREDSDDE